MLPYSKNASTAVLGGAPTQAKLTMSGMIGYVLGTIVTTAPLRYRRETLSQTTSNPSYPAYWVFRMYQAGGAAS